MKDLGSLSYFLGIAVTRHACGLFLSQRKYAMEIIERAGMVSCKSSPTPVDTKPKMSAHVSTPYEDPSHYRSLAEALQYLTFTKSPGSILLMQCSRCVSSCMIHVRSICMLLSALCDIFRGHLIMVYICIRPLYPLSFLTQMLTRVVVLTLVSLPRVILCFLAITCSLGRLNVNLLCLVPVSKPSIMVWPMWSLNHVGYVIFFSSSVVRFRKQRWYIATM